MNGPVNGERSGDGGLSGERSGDNHRSGDLVGPVTDPVVLTLLNPVEGPVNGPVSGDMAGDTEGSSEDAPLLLHDPGTLSMLGDDTQTVPPHTQVTAVPESVMSWLSRNNFCLARCDGPAQDFAGFIAAGGPLLVCRG